MCVLSTDAESHVLQLAMLALLLAAGGTCSVDSLITTTRDGHLDLLALCAPHLTDINARRRDGRHTLLEIAARHGHVEAVTILISAGASVNVARAHCKPRPYPPLWVCRESPVAVLQVLLDAGADASWRNSRGVSIVQHLRQTSRDAVGLENNIALLVQYGAVDDKSVGKEGGSQQRRERPSQSREYRGWILRRRADPIDWVQGCVLAGRDEECGCSSCTLQAAGGHRAERSEKERAR